MGVLCHFSSHIPACVVVGKRGTPQRLTAYSIALTTPSLRFVLNDLIELLLLLAFALHLRVVRKIIGLFRFEDPNCDVPVRKTRSNYVIYVFPFSRKKTEFYLEQMHSM